MAREARLVRKFDHEDTDTNMHVERCFSEQAHACIMYGVLVTHNIFPFSFHNKLKCKPAYLNSQVHNRVDYLITVLLQIEEDMFFVHQSKHIHWKRNY